ncbi:MAG: hypothetical protein JRH07_06550 [Deltaproteobacteria bacterium]|nr:hypothetical protein [Deltaproteobacteria bacterium]MBW2121494.1 hypothetical protein [Deltaproteobacteria bacterium]
MDEDSGQVLFEFDEARKDLDRALRLIRASGAGIADLRLFPAGPDGMRCALVRLTVPDTRGVVLTLAEHGFSRIKGYGAVCNRVG